MKHKPIRFEMKSCDYEVIPVSWPTGDEWRVLECDQPWFNDDEALWVLTVTRQLWNTSNCVNCHTVMSGEYQNVISCWLSTMIMQILVSFQYLVIFDSNPNNPYKFIYNAFQPHIEVFIATWHYSKFRLVNRSQK
jgi:hypothetical protein